MVEKLGSELMDLNRRIKRVLDDSGYSKHLELGVKRKEDDPQHNFLIDRYSSILYQLNDVKSDLDYLNKPVRHEGNLYKNSGGRYEINDSVEFTSGNSIEFLKYDEWDECEKWIAARIEHTDGDYYIYGHKDVSLEGLRVRTRR